MEKLDNIRGAVFDLDGTLFDSGWVWEETDRRFLLARGIQMPPDYPDAVSSMEFLQAAEYTVKRFGLPDSPVSLVEEWHAMARRAYETEVKLKPHAKEYLTCLYCRGVKLAIATSSTPELFLPTLERNRIKSLFSATVTTSEVLRGKGFPDVYTEAARRIGVAPRECAVFEDVYAGVASAKAGGFTAVGVYDKYSDFETERIKSAADMYITGFSELL